MSSSILENVSFVAETTQLRLTSARVLNEFDIAQALVVAIHPLVIRVVPPSAQPEPGHAIGKLALLTEPAGPELRVAHERWRRVVVVCVLGARSPVAGVR